MVGPCSGRRVAFAGAEGVHGQHEETQLHQPQAAGLHHRIASRPGPVAVDDEHGRRLALAPFGDVGVGRHPHVRPRLEEEFFDTIAIALEDADFLRLQVAGFFRERPHCGEHRAAQGGPPDFPGLEIGWRFILRRRSAASERMKVS